MTTAPSITSSFTFTPTSTQTPTSTITPKPSDTPTLSPTSTASPTLAVLELFYSRVLRVGVKAQAYLEDQCAYLRMRWSAEGSQPGTVVVPIMFHSNMQNGTRVTDLKDITADQFMNFVDYALSLGFETITS